MATDASELTPLEHATLVIDSQGLSGQDARQILRTVEPGWSDSTYGRRLQDARVSLERRGLLSRDVSRREVVWLPTSDGLVTLMSQELLSVVQRLHRRAAEAEYDANERTTELYHLRLSLETATTEVEQLRQKFNDIDDVLGSRLIATFDKLGLNETWIEVLVSVTLTEVMARHKLRILDPFKAHETLGFRDLLRELEVVITEKEGGTFIYNKEVADLLSSVRNRMVHDGLRMELRPRQVEGIIAFVKDLYEQLFPTDD